MGKQTKIYCFSEVEFADPSLKGIRPDGLIIVSTGRTVWSALVEAKIKNATLEVEQLEKYAQAAKKLGINSLISISNELVSRPDLHHVPLPKILVRNLEYLHFSWASILSNAQIMHAKTELSDPEQAFILGELIKYLKHDSSGINRFDQMSASWSEVVKLAVQLFPLNKSNNDVVAVAQDWIQESRDLSMKVAEQVNEKVLVKYSNRARSDLSILTKDVINEICETKTLTCDLDIPNTAGTISIQANLTSRQVTASMSFTAPKDKKSTSARVNWLLRMLKEDGANELIIGATWPSRVANTYEKVSALREDPKSLQCENPTHTPINFIIQLVVDDPRAFQGRRKFIELVESTAERFYELAGQHIKAWQAPPPKATSIPSDHEESDL